MNLLTHIAKHLKDFYFGGNWTVVNLKGTLADVTWQQATTQIHDFNTIATLVFHMSYYVGVVTKVLQGGPLEGSDKYSFAHPPILSQEDWDRFLEKTFADVENLVRLIEQFPEHRLWEDFSENKYGNYYRNLVGIIEHCHYHLGQIVLIKKILLQTNGK